MNEIINQLKDMEQEVLSIRENISDLIDIAKLPGNAKEVADILLSESQMIERHIGKSFYNYFIRLPLILLLVRYFLKPHVII